MGLFAPKGVHVLADGQYGSTGKGALAAWLAMEHLKGFVYPGEHTPMAGVISNAGPNSGHTFYHNDEKHVLKQLPTFAVASALLGRPIPVYLSAGAIIDPDILSDEMEKYPTVPVFIHPNAAVINAGDKTAEHFGSIAAVAGTRSGTGVALSRKVLREDTAVFDGWMARAGFKRKNLERLVKVGRYTEHDLDTLNKPYFMEISQGFDLGINGRFYPKVTSRECTFMQGFTDARIPPNHYARGYLTFRTFPIRVGNVDGFDSGGWHRDQREVAWSDLGINPERTTVTNRERRIASWSWDQFYAAMRANEPTHVFLNFLNYLDGLRQYEFVQDHRRSLQQWTYNGRPPYGLIYGSGPRTGDINERFGVSADARG